MHRDEGDEVGVGHHPGPASASHKRAVAWVFFLNGIAYASWLSRLPAIRVQLDLTAAQIGLLLLCLSLGTVCALPVSGWVITRLGPGRTIQAAAAFVVLGLGGLAVGVWSGSVVPAGLSLFAYGVGTSTWDVAMNVEAADVERRFGRTLMPRFHAAFSAGTIAGAASGAAAAATSVPTSLHLVGVAVAVSVAVPLAVGHFPRRQASGSLSSGTTAGGTMAAWRERRTLLLGCMVLGFALAEGLANDWLALTLVDAYGSSEAVGAVAFAVFVTAMTVGRLLGGSAVDRWGRVPALRASAVLVAGGAALVAFSTPTGGAMLGALLWGAGASLGFPLGMAAAADEERRAAARVAVVSSIGYAAFLGGPPAAGLLADALGYRRAILIAVVAAVIGGLLAGAARASGQADRLHRRRRSSG